MYTNIEKTTLLAIFLFFLTGFCFAQQAPTEAEKALEQKLDEANNGGKTANRGKKKAGKNTTPAEAPAGETEREKLVRLRALAIEANANLKKAEQETRKASSPAMKQAEKEIDKEKKQQAKAEQEARNIIAAADVTGCPAGSVEVFAAAEPAHGVINIFQSVVIRVVNNGALKISEISGPKGLLARNLCSGGAMTMTFYLGFYDPDSMNVPLVAIARTPDGGVATAQFSVYLNRGNAYQRVDNQIWQISLNRQWQTR